MGKAKTSHRQKKSLGSTRKMKSKLKLKKDAEVIEYSPSEKMMDEEFIAKAVWECLKNNDPEGVVEIIKSHLEIVNKVKAAQATDLSRSTLYNAFKGKNPTVKTLAKLVNCFG